MIHTQKLKSSYKDVSELQKRWETMKIQTPNKETQTILDIIVLLGLRMSL